MGFEMSSKASCWRTTRLYGDNPGEGDEQWCAHEENNYKINVDAATFVEKNRFGYGWVLRDARGQVLHARTRSWSGYCEPVLAEALGVKEALSWIKASKITKVTIETDSLIVVQAFRSSVTFTSPFGCCIKKCKRMFFRFNQCLFMFC
uniref:RNase H type-1 domain-containing protein n=1 Tax=Cannabis sativa TaxID=3483 RepID=A0A803QEM2_CANSA